MSGEQWPRRVGGVLVAEDGQTWEEAGYSTGEDLAELLRDRDEAAGEPEVIGVGDVVREVGE